MGVISFLKDPAYRKKFISSQDLFFKALGRPPKGTEVWDMTAGLLVDTLFLLQRGLRVKSFENHPEVLKEIKAALVEASSKLNSDRFLPSCSQSDLWHRLGLDRLELEEADSIEVLQALPEGGGPTVIYLDPMFDEEARSASALPKKGAQWLRKNVPMAPQATKILLEEAIRVTAGRVVVKRPKHAKVILPSPRHQFMGRSVRFDVYFREQR
jgi:16S rRNA (guanine1516-N2)-methyltransferase